MFLIVLYSCKKEDTLKKNESKNEIITDTLKIKQKIISALEKDSTLKPQKVDLIYILSEKQIDTLIGFCNCDKDVKNNTLKIQIRTEFPALSELKKGNRNATEFQMGVPRQYRFITFYLKDSIVKKTKIFKASTEPQFENEKIDSTSFQNYKIVINRFNLVHDKNLLTV